MKFKEAFECYKRAAEEFKCPDAMYRLGEIYFDKARAKRLGVDEDKEKAIELLVDASSFGNYKASKYLVLHYSETDPVEAFKYGMTAYEQISDDLKPYHFLNIRN